MGPVLGAHARTDCTRDARAAEPRLPAPDCGRLEEGQRLTPNAPHNGGRPPPPGTAPHHSRGTQPPQGMQAKGTVLGPHTHTPATTARGWRTPTAPPVGGQFREEERLTTDAPHNGGRHPPRERPSASPTASKAGPQGRTLWGLCWVPRPHWPRPGHTGRGAPAARPRGRAQGGGTAPDTRPPSQRWQATPPRDGPPSAPQHAAPTGHAGQGDSVGPPHPLPRPHSSWVADPNSPPSGRAVGGGGAPDLRRLSERWKAPPTGMPFRRPHSEQSRPARAHAVGPVLGPHARTNRTRDARVTEPRLPAPDCGRLGEGQRLTPNAPHNGGRPPPPGTAPHHSRGTQPPQGMQAKGTVLGPHTHTPPTTARGWRTPTAPPVGGQFREEERLTTDAPHNGGRHPPRKRPSASPTASKAGPQGRTLWGRCWVPRPHWPRPGHTGRGAPAARPRGRAQGGGTAPDTRPPSQRWQATPPGTAPHRPHSTQPPQGMQAKGTVLGPHTHFPAPTARGWRTPTARPVGGQSGEGERLTSDAPQNGGRPSPPGTAPHRPHSTQPPQGMQAKGTVLGPHTHFPAPTARGWRTPTARPVGGQSGEGERLTSDAPQNGGRPSPPGTAPHRPHSTQPPQGMQAKGTVLGPHTHFPAPTARGWRTPTARPVGGQSGEGERLTSDAPQNGGRPSPPGTAPHCPHSTQPPQGMQAKGTVLGPHTHFPAPTARGWRTPTARPVGGQSGEGERLTSDASQNGGRHPHGDALPPAPQRAKPARKGARCGAGA